MSLNVHAPNGACGSRPDRGRSFVPIAKAVLSARSDRDAWSISRGELWCLVSPIAGLPRLQGWKLHLAATASSAGRVLQRSLPLLLDAGVAFKFASTVEDVVDLNAPNFPRAGSGKFITAYPDDDAQLTELAQRLHAATVGEPAPAILSDRRYRPDSAVHYRYGAFQGATVLSNDGEYQTMLVDPQGELVEDRREPRFTPPPWARSPFAAAQPAHRPGAVLKLGGRFRVIEAVRHANKGGVYGGIDESDGREVILKEARAHVAGDARGHDARDVLRQEAAALEHLAALRIAPRPVALFEQGGHLFLAQERVPGVTLRRWVADAGTDVLPPPMAHGLALRLTDALGRAHDAGVVIRDFTPNNLIVTPDGDVRLIDLELAVVNPGEPDHDLGRGHHTPGYGAPEQLSGARPHPAADAFSLGATLCYLLCGEDPFFAPDIPVVRTQAQRLAEWLRSGPRALAIPASVAQLILELTDEDPDRRPTVMQAKGRLAAAVIGPAHELAGRTLEAPARLDDDAWKAAVQDAVAHTLTAMTAGHARLWPSTPFGAGTDPCNVQHGASGVLGVLCRAHATIDDGPSLLDAIATTARWIGERVERESRRPPGLYFGAAGIAWALFDAGRALDDAALMERALAVGLAQPPDWPGPDVTHGIAGLGLTLLHLWRATGAPELMEHASRCADTLAGRVEDGPGGIGWRCPPSFHSRFAGQRFYGFAHGTAGIGQFLLDMGVASGRGALVDLAGAAGDALIDAAVDIGGAGLAWPSGPDGAQDPLRYWCNGSAGIGTFLVRLHIVSGQRRHREAAEAAAVAVMQHKWRVGLAYCHGLAGNGDFLLDLAQLLGEGRFQAWAEDLATIMWSKRVMRHGGATFGDDSNALVADFNVGLGGILAFLLRLRRGGPRMWLDAVAAQ